MKNSLFILLLLFLFACSDSGTTNDEATTTESTNADESVEIGSGSEISPQLEFESDSQKVFEVDTVTSTTNTNGQRQ